MLENFTRTKRNVLIMLALIGIGIFSFLAILFKKTLLSPRVKEKSPLVEEIPGKFKPGEIGEILIKEDGQERPLVTPTLPLTIFSTTGTILEVKKDNLIVEGRGFNFADQKPRKLTVIFTDSTITFTKEKIKYQGFSGLKYLKPGMEILISSAENIRGKIEFKAKTISPL